MYNERKIGRRSRIMNKYVCLLCGYVYDEEEQGVKWEELPEDWVCPLCGAPKDQFQKVED